MCRHAQIFKNIHSFEQLNLLILIKQGPRYLVTPHMHIQPLDLIFKVVLTMAEA